MQSKIITYTEWKKYGDSKDKNIYKAVKEARNRTYVENGDVRIKEFFAWHPVFIHKIYTFYWGYRRYPMDYSEHPMNGELKRSSEIIDWKWLQRVKVKQVQCYDSENHACWPIWVNVEFLEASKDNKMSKTDTYLVKPIVTETQYDNIRDVLPLISAGTHKAKVLGKSGVLKGKLKLEKTAAIVDGEVKDIELPKIKKEKSFFRFIHNYPRPKNLEFPGKLMIMGILLLGLATVPTAAFFPICLVTIVIGSIWVLFNDPK